MCVHTKQTVTFPSLSVWPRSAGAGVCHVDEEAGQRETSQAAPHRPRRRRAGQHSEIRRRGRRRGRPGTETHTERLSLSHCLLVLISARVAVIGLHLIIQEKCHT